MRALRVAIVAGLVGGCCWLANVGVMLLQGRPDLHTTSQFAAFVIGGVGVFVAGGAVGAYLTRGKPAAVQVFSALAGLAIVAAVLGVGQAALLELPGDSWMQEEAIFAVVGLTTALSATVALFQRAGRATVAH